MSQRLAQIAAALFLCLASASQAANVIVVTENVDQNLDLVPDDQGLIDWLVAEGHSVDVRRGDWMVLDPNRIDALNAADLIVVSRSADSANYCDGYEPTQWNSVTTPLLLMNAYFARTSRWNWVNSDTVTNGTRYTYAEAVNTGHPIFRDVSLMELDPEDLGGFGKAVRVVDPNIGAGITSFLGTSDIGNGRLIARPVLAEMAWIVEWDAGVEFYAGAGRLAGGKRMLFCAGTQEAGDTPKGAFNLTSEGRQMLHNAISYLLGGANIILVTEAVDWNRDGVRDDRNLEEFLVSEGHIVDIRPDYWISLNSEKIAQLNAADLVIVSRITNSANYYNGAKAAQWNSLATPLLQMNAYFVRNIRWNWVSSETTTNNTRIVHLEAVEPTHPLFRNVPLTALYSGNANDPINVVRMIDLSVGSGITSLIGTSYVGNGRLLARPTASGMSWIVEWDPGVEFYPGAGQYAGGRRMAFCAGTQEVQVRDPYTQQMVTTTQGELNLTAEGLQMFRNAIAHLLRSEAPVAGQ